MKPSNYLLTKAAQAIILIMFGLTLSCQQQSAIKQSEKEMEAMVEKHKNIWNSGDITELDKIYASNSIIHRNRDGAIDTVNIDSHKRFITYMRSRYPDLTVETEQMLIKDDMLVWHLTMAGTRGGTTDDSPSAGKKFKIPIVCIYRVINGKIAEEWRIWNEASFLEQLGHTIIPPSTTNEN